MVVGCSGAWPRGATISGGSYWIPGSWILRMLYTDDIPCPEPRQESNGAGQYQEWLILDFRVVIGQVWRNRLFLQAFPGGRDRCGILGKSRLISSTSVLYRVWKTPESNMSLRRKVMVPRRPAKYAFVVDEIVKLRSWA